MILIELCIRTCIRYRVSKSIAGQLNRSVADRFSVIVLGEILYPVVFLAEKARFLFPFRAITCARSWPIGEEARPFNLEKKKEGIMSGRDLKAN